LSRLAQMHVQINESGRDNQPFRVNFLVGSAANLIGEAYLGNTSVAQKHIHDGIDLCRRVE